MTTVDEVVAQAERWLGTTEQPMGSNRVPGITDWYGIKGPWCAMFVSRVFFDAGLPLPASIPKGFAYTPAGAAWFRRQGRWVVTAPKRGYVVFFDFPGDSVNRISHVGIVSGVRADGSVETIEGNTDERGGRTGGKVMRRLRKVGIVGYGIPAYAPSVRPPTPEWDYEEDEVRTKLLTVSTDANGHGYDVWNPGFPNPVPTGHVVQGTDPRSERHYGDITDDVVVKASPRSGGLVVTVSNGPPKSSVGVYVSAAPG
jgi:surface antigen